MFVAGCNGEDVVRTAAGMLEICRCTSRWVWTALTRDGSAEFVLDLETNTSPARLMIESNQEDDGFTSVTYKKPPRAPKNRKGKNRFRERTLDEKLAAREEALTRSGYTAKCRELLRTSLSPPSTDNSPSTSACTKPTRVVCLGLGSVSESTKAQDQYVLLKELLLELGTCTDSQSPVQLYDPAFTPEDASFLTAQGHKVLSSEFQFRLSSPTLLYIPHGPRSLFNSLLEQNWSAAKLSNVIIFGNRLDLYDDPTYSGTTSQSSGTNAKIGELDGGMHWVRKAIPLFNIVPLPSTKEHMEAFNDLALEWVEPSQIGPAVEQGQLPRTLATAPGQDDADDEQEEKTTVQGLDEETERSLDDSVEALKSLQLSPNKDGTR